jgi:hypothetical protein
VNAALLRAVLTHAEDHPDLLDNTVYGEARPSGDIAADIPGRALLESGWTLTADNTFRSPDGDREIHGFAGIEREAQAALGLSDDELWNHGDFDSLFTLPEFEAVARLRDLTEQAEAATANA